MSRHEMPLYCSEAKYSSIEVLVAEGGWAAVPTSDLDQLETLNFISAYVNLGGDTSGAATSKNLFSSMTHVREHYIRLPMDRAGPALAGLWNNFPKSDFLAVVVLPTYENSTFHLVQEIIDTIVNQSRHAPLMMFAIGTNTADWSGLVSVKYFVESSAERLDLDAAAFFKVFAACMAPEAPLDFDFADLESCLGSATHPSRLLHGQWSKDDSTLRFSNEEDYEATLQSRDVFVSILGSVGSLAVSSELMNAWRNIVQPEAYIGFSITSGFFADSGSSLLPFVAICRT